MTTKELRPRDKRDFYPTPRGLVRAALRLIEARHIRTILDPGAGEGAWGSVASEIWPAAKIVGVDLNFPYMPPGYDMWFNHDYLGSSAAIYSGVDLVIGNPPYKYAEEFVRQAIDDLVPGGLCLFLMRLAFLEGQDRGDCLWRECPPMSVHVLSRRPSFTGNGKTDATAYAVYLWGKGWQGDTLLKWLDWKDD